jgi:hypothetical protein
MSRLPDWKADQGLGPVLLDFLQHLGYQLPWWVDPGEETFPSKSEGISQALQVRPSRRISLALPVLPAGKQVHFGVHFEVTAGRLEKFRLQLIILGVRVAA